MTTFLRKDVLISLHELYQAQHGHCDAIVVNAKVLDRVLQLPLASTGTDTFYLATLYIQAIQGLRPFKTNNLGTAWLACETFLNLNGERSPKDQVTTTVMLLHFWSSEITLESFVEWLSQSKAHTE